MGERCGAADTFPGSVLGPTKGKWGIGRLHSLCADGLVDGIGSMPSSSRGGRGEEGGGPELCRAGSQRGLRCGACPR